MAVYTVKRMRAVLVPTAFLAACGVLVGFSHAARQGAANGLSLCAVTVIPALFPFMCLCEWMARSGAAESLTRLAKPLFRLWLGPLWQGGAAVLLCMLGGYPMGAAAAVRLRDHGDLSPGQTRRLTLAAFSPSPVFAITAVGGVLLGSPQAGRLLWAGNTLAAVLIAALACRWPTDRGLYPVQHAKPADPSDSLADAFVSAVSASCRHMLTICGMVVLFSALGALLSELALPRTVSCLFSGLLEVTTASAAAVKAGVSLPALAAILAFGGICTHGQIKAIAGDAMPSYPRYGAVRLLQSGLAYGFTALACKLFPAASQTMATGDRPAVTFGSPLPSAALVLTIVVFLSWLDPGSRKGRTVCEKPKIYS